MMLLRFAILGKISLLTAANEQPLSMEHMQLHTSDDALSLLQYQARLSKHQTAEETGEEWSGGYMKCTEQKPLTDSGCRTIGGGKNFALHPRLCAEQAKATGVDSFSFMGKGDESWCWLKRCDSVDMKWESSADNWQVFSRFCGLPRSRVEVKGTCRAAFTGNLIFPKPKRSVCKKSPKFKTISTNNLGGAGPNSGDEGHMRFTNTLPGVDMVVKADQNYQAHNSAKNGVHLEKFGRISMKSGTQSMFNFQFVKSGTDEPVRVHEFIFSVFDIDQFGGCYGQMTVNASHYSSYHLSDNTELIVKTDAGDVGRMASSSFTSSMWGTGKDNPKKPRELTPVQAARSVSFVFKNRKFFNMGFEISDAAAGQNILFAGKSSLLDAVCPKKNNRR